MTVLHVCSLTIIKRFFLFFFFSVFSFSESTSLIEGRCPGSKALFFNQSSSFATSPIIDLNERSFTISCWIKQAKPNDQLEAIYGDWEASFSQFLLSVQNQQIIFHRHKNGKVNEWWSLTSSYISLSTWTNVVVTWQHVAGRASIYADGKVIGVRKYSPGETFYAPTGKLYKIGNDNHRNSHQFHGAVMDLYVFSTALSLDKINRLRGERFDIQTCPITLVQGPNVCKVDKTSERNPN